VEGLGINLPVLLAQIVNFAILFVLLYVFAYKPVLKMLDQRSAKIKGSMEQAEAIRQRTAQTDEEIRKKLAEAQKEGQALLAQAAQMGEKVKEEPSRRPGRKRSRS